MAAIMNIHNNRLNNNDGVKFSISSATTPPLYHEIEKKMQLFQSACYTFTDEINN